MGAWLLSHAPIDKMPYVVIDYKGDSLLNSITHARHISPDEVPKSKHPGLYIAHMHPSDEDGVEKLMLKMWEQEHIGMFADEAYMIPKNSAAFQGILTQGRSKKIPSIILSQRPVMLSKFVFTEADHFSVFHLSHEGDRKKVGEYLPRDIDLEENAPEFHSHWYDVKRNKTFLLHPVPDADIILERFDDVLKKLKPQRKFF